MSKLKVFIEAEVISVEDGKVILGLRLFGKDVTKPVAVKTPQLREEDSYQLGLEIALQDEA